MRSKLIATLVLFLLAVPAIAEDAVKAKLTSIAEYRIQKVGMVKPPIPGIDPAKDDQAADKMATLEIGLDLQGDLLASANARGDLVFKVTDEKGNALASLPEERRREPGEYLPLARERDQRSSAVLHRNRISIQLASLAPPRSATKISVEGKITVLTGKVTDVVVPGVTKLIGKKLDQKELESAGLEVTVKSMEPNSSIEGTRVYFDVKGKFRHLVTFELLDDKDKVIGSGGEEYFEIGLPPEDRAWSVAIFANGRLDHEKFKLRVRVVLDAKDTVVPFVLKDIALP